LVADLREALPEATVHFGSHDDLEVSEDGTVQVKVRCTWEQFLQDPAAAQNDVSVIFPGRELLVTSEDVLVEQIGQAYEKLFPLVLLAVGDDPLPAISRYLESIGKPPPPPPDPYDRQTFLDRTYLSPEQADDLYDLLRDKRQIILYGPPGTGKTFVAQELAKWVTGLAEPPADRLEIIQFHPAYSYEDFIEGIRPESKSAGEGRYLVDYPPRPGVFRRFCEAVPSDLDQKCVCIIDEINRGNIPRIFGELMLLLEYRERDVPLPYSGKRFRIPPNVYLIGTMNTADRSIALVDFALRRRFHFFHFGANPDLLERWLADHPVPIPYLAKLYRRLSEEAIDDPDYAVGPSYFMDPNLTEEKLERIWRYSIVPYLAEYFVEQKARLDRWRWDGDLPRRIRGEA
jgi:5-methylcytosine-specific restriction protein B